MCKEPRAQLHMIWMCRIRGNSNKKKEKKKKKKNWNRSLWMDTNTFKNYEISYLAFFLFNLSFYITIITVKHCKTKIVEKQKPS